MSSARRLVDPYEAAVSPQIGPGGTGVGSTPWWYLVLLAVLFFWAAHDLGTPLYNSPMISMPDDLGLSLEAINEGSLERRAAFLGMGFAGIIMLWRHRRSGWRLEPVVATCAGLFLAWSALSIVWADDPALTFRRLVVFWLLSLAVAGAVVSTPRSALPAFIGLSSAAYLAVGIVNEVRLGTFVPLMADYRFSGTLHPNAQGINCAMLALAGLWYLSSTGRRRRWLWLAATGAGVVFLLLTRSRTAFAGFVGAAMIVLVLQLRPRRRFVAAALLVNAGILLLFAYRVGLLDPVLDLFLLGRGARDVSTLNSRLPLWQILWDYAAERPLLGFGYSGFMTERHAAEIAVLQRFGVAGAHSLYLEVILGVGIVGLILLLSVFAASIGTGIRDSARHRPSPESLFVGILVFELMIGFLESTILMPSWRLIPLLILGASCIALPSPGSRAISVKRVASSEGQARRAVAARRAGQVSG